MNFPRVVALGCALAALFAIPARCAELQLLDGMHVNLAQPSGFCLLTKKHPYEKAIIEQQEELNRGLNVILQVAMPCDDLPRVREGGPANRWTIWRLESPRGNVATLPLGDTREQRLEYRARRLPKLDMKAIAELISKRLGEGSGGIKLATSGLVAIEPDAVYTASVHEAPSARGQQIVTDVSASTILGDRIIAFSTYVAQSAGDTSGELLAQAKDVVARSVQASDQLLAVADKKAGDLLQKTAADWRGAPNVAKMRALSRASLPTIAGLSQTEVVAFMSGCLDAGSSRVKPETPVREMLNYCQSHK